MAKQPAIIGSVSWDDPALDFNKKKEEKPKDENKMEFVKISEHGTQLRLITDAHQYYVHNGVTFEGSDLDPAKMPKYGYTIKCSAFSSDQKCPICELNEGKPKEEQNRWIKKWYFGVIERTLTDDGDVDHSKDKAKILDVKKSIVGKFGDSAKNKRWGNPIQYDFVVTKNPGADPQNYYGVLPVPKDPLTAEEIQMKEAFPMERLQSMVTPPSYQEVTESIERIRNWLKVNDNSSKSSTPAKEKEVEASATEKDFLFAQR